ncbi:MAG: oligoendopeptidase F [Firmicutes bacterium]|nr:oligoendopeptidase F [Bacillota bacterium]
MTETPVREIPEAYTWRLEDIFESDEAWEEAFVALRRDIPQVARFKGRLAEGPAALLDCLSTRDELWERALRVLAYASLARDLNTREPRYQAMHDRAVGLYVQLRSETAYIDPEILQIAPEDLRSWVDRTPGLETYRHALEELLRERPHVLSSSEEQILAMAGEIAHAPEEIFGMLNDADLKFPTVRNEKGEPVELTHARFLRLMESPDREVRREAFRAFYGTYATVRHTMAATLSANVKKDVFFARVRRFGSSLEAALFPDNVPVAVYDNLIATLRRHLPLLHRYMELRKRVLGVSELHMYDVYVPLVGELDRRFPYDEAKALVVEACRPLGETYVRELARGLAERWVDVYERPGKRAGAYMNGVYGVHPFVLTNWQENLDSVFTLAHEMGHAMHSFFTQRAQAFVNAHYSTFVAEVASTTNEALLLNHLLEKAQGERERLYLLNHHLEGFRTTVFRQAMFAEFERRIHEIVEQGEALTADRLDELYRELNAAYYGPAVVTDEEIAREWMRIPHFYYNFYVYKYATGFCAATALARGILEGGAEERERYLRFLSLGGSMHPIDQLRVAGVDMAAPQPIEEAMAVFAAALEEAERLFGA